VDILNATEARSKLYRLIDQTSEYHQPIVITGKRKNAVLVSEEKDGTSMIRMSRGKAEVSLPPQAF